MSSGEPYRDFRDQFVLAPADRASPEGWPARELHGWRLAAHPSLPVRDLLTRDGSRAGWLLGHVVDAPDALGPIVLPSDRPDRVSEAELEAALDGLSGRYAGVAVTRRLERVYLDPCGSLAAVYAPGRCVVASTLCLIDPDTPARRARLRANEFHPAGLTGDPSMQRILPNHYLDLRDWRCVRHWPRGALERVAAERAHEPIAAIAEQTRRILRAVARDRTLYLTLSGGRDSRMVAACARELFDRAHFITLDYGPDRSSRADVELAREIASRLALSHRVLPVEPLTDEAKRTYLFRIGHAGHPGKARDHRALSRHLDASAAWLPAFGGEIARAHYWKKLPFDERKNRSPRHLLERMHLPNRRRSRRALEQWLEQVPEVDLPLLHDLLYLEQRMGCWVGPHLYGTATLAVTLLPLNSRRSIDAMLRTPIHDRREQRVPQDVIRQACPELAAFPYKANLLARGRAAGSPRTAAPLPRGTPR